MLVAYRRLTEREGRIGPPASGQRDTVVEGVRWRSRESGSPGIPGSRRETAVVYVHGFLSSSSTWKRVLSQASAGRLAVAVDLPGAGFSDRPWPYDYTVFGQAERLLKFLEVRGISRAVLVGNSLGGAVCEAAAASRPDRIVGLVLVDAAGPTTRIPVGFRLLRTPLVGEIQMELCARPVIGFTLRQRLYARGERVTEETVDDWWTPITLPGTRRAALEAIRTRRSGTEGLLEKIRVPTLVVWGADDSLLPASDGLALASAIRGARFVLLPDSGHLPQEETPDAFARAVAPFVREIDGEQP